MVGELRSYMVHNEAKHPPANAADVDSISKLGRFPWRKKWQPTPVFCLENSMDRGAWGATVHEVTREI